MDINSRFLFACSGVKGEPAGETWYTPTFSDGSPDNGLILEGMDVNPSTGAILMKVRNTPDGTHKIYRTYPDNLGSWTYLSTVSSLSSPFNEGLIYTGTKWIATISVQGPTTTIFQSTNDGSSWSVQPVYSSSFYAQNSPTLRFGNIKGSGNNLGARVSYPGPPPPRRPTRGPQTLDGVIFSSNGGGSWGNLIAIYPYTSFSDFGNVGGSEWIYSTGGGGTTKADGYISTNNGASWTGRRVNPPSPSHVNSYARAYEKDSNGYYYMGGLMSAPTSNQGIIWRWDNANPGWNVIYGNGSQGTEVNHLRHLEDNYMIWSESNTSYTDPDGFPSGVQKNNPYYIPNGINYSKYVAGAIYIGSNSPSGSRIRYSTHY